jgi:putative nucleotidyltransferase with HDIG domain
MDRTTGVEPARRICARLRAAGCEAYLVGGCVRDLLLGRAAKDFDIATAAPPARVAELFPGAVPAGAHFGVMLVPQGEARFEVATYRSDHAYADGRRPEYVVFETDVRQDVLRRDFTINALLMDPETGAVIDHVGGRADLESGVVRAIGDARTRFEEDHLRMLRAVRFAARFGFTIADDTLRAIQDLHSFIARVSAERVREELTRILTEGAARRGFELLDESRLLGVVLPEIQAMRGVEQPPEYHPEGDVWTHTLLLLAGLHDATPELAWGALLHDVGKPGSFRRAPDRIRFDGHVELGVEMARAILERLRFGNAFIDRVLALIANHMRFKDVPRMRTSTLKRFLRQEDFAEHLELHRLDSASGSGDLTTYEFARERLAQLPPDELKPPPVLTGDDLIEAGYAPGPAFGKMLRAVEDAQLEGAVRGRAEALLLVRSRFGAP